MSDNYTHIRQYLEDLINETRADPLKPAWNVEVKEGHIPPSWNYIDGVMMKAILEMYIITKDRHYYDFVVQFLNAYIDEDGLPLNYNELDYNLDNINGGKVLLDVFRAEALPPVAQQVKFAKAYERLYDQVLNQPRCENRCNNFWHKAIYPNQVWLDGLYMVMPFYMDYVERVSIPDKESKIKDIFDQFAFVNQYMRQLPLVSPNPNQHLPKHGYDDTDSIFWANRQTGLSLSYWSRSIAWYTMALVDTIDKMHGDSPQRATLISYFRSMCNTLLNYWDPDTGLYWQVTDQGGRAGNYLETSSSAAFAYAMMRGARLGYLNEGFSESGLKTFRSLVDQKFYYNRTTQKYHLKDICLVAGLGGQPPSGNYPPGVRDGSYEYYISEPRVEDDAKGVAPFLLAYTEYIQLVERGEA